MKPCLSQSLTMPLTFAEDIAHYADAGCDAIEVWLTKLENHLEQHSLDQTRALLQERGITHLLFGGVTTEVCVQTSMREANDRGYDCLLLEDCTESYFPAFKAATLDMVRAQGGIVGWTAPSTALLAALHRGQ